MSSPHTHRASIPNKLPGVCSPGGGVSRSGVPQDLSPHLHVLPHDRLPGTLRGGRKHVLEAGGMTRWGFSHTEAEEGWKSLLLN